MGNPPSPRLAHTLITRFNIASPGREMPIRNRPGWLDRRFDLFERYCLPSVAAQSERAFDWLIYFDEATPDTYRERIERARELFAYTPIFVGSFDMAQSARDIATDGAKVVTTRLDNDDAMARDFIARVQAAASEAEPGTVLNFPRGLALRGGRAFSAFDESNPFASLVEDTAAPVRTIWSAPHDALGRDWRVVQIDAPPMWLQVVHGENVSNRIKGARVSAGALRQTFALHPDVRLTADGRFARFMDRAMIAPLRQLREALLRTVKRALGKRHPRAPDRRG